ncbi:MAG TPA: hypothetical protein VEA63_03370 [Opitutus sp.]|nr:hypothetical protein [Opitutus sp.]
MKTSLLTLALPFVGALAFAAELAPTRATLQAPTAAPAARAPTNASTAANTNGADATDRPNATAGISGDTSAKVNEGLPKFTPPPPAPPPSPVGTPAPLPAETASTDFTDNSVIRLPNYDVREQELPEFKERELLTREGRIDAAMTRFPGLKFGPFDQLNARVGLVLLEQEHEVERRTELRELYDFMAFMRSVPRATANPEPAAAE